MSTRKQWGTAWRQVRLDRKEGRVIYSKGCLEGIARDRLQIRGKPEPLITNKLMRLSYSRARRAYKD
jgi:hypothetical protein